MLVKFRAMDKSIISEIFKELKQQGLLSEEEYYALVQLNLAEDTAK